MLDREDWCVIAVFAFCLALAAIAESQSALFSSSTWVQSSAAVATMVFTGGLVYVGYKQVEIARMQATSVDTQVALMAAQTDLMVMQKELLRQGHVATYRPKLKVHRLDLLAFSDDAKVAIRTKIFNIGQSSASNVMWQVDCLVVPLHTRLDRYNKYHGRGGFGAAELESGDYWEFDFETKDQVTAQEAGDVRARIKEMLFFGEIAYLDGVNVTRRTSFVRRYDPVARRFVKTDNPDDEFEG